MLVKFVRTHPADPLDPKVQDRTKFLTTYFPGIRTDITEDSWTNIYNVTRSFSKCLLEN